MFKIILLIICQDSPKDESGLLKAVQNVHATIDKEIAAGTNPNNVFVCGFSQGGLFFPLFLFVCVSPCEYLFYNNLQKKSACINILLLGFCYC